MALARAGRALLGSPAWMQSRAAQAGVALGGAVAFWYAWTRTHPSPCPYSMRFSVAVPRPGLTHERLARSLAPRPGERLLEVGPGTGCYTIPVARALEPGGTLDVVDVQQEMLGDTMRNARAQGVENVTPRLADGSSLPYADASFDGAFLVTVLGEIPDQDAALRELYRVVKPGGRVVVGEVLLDPDWVTPRALHTRAERVGLRFDGQVGSRFAYFARLVRDPEAGG